MEAIETVNRVLYILFLLCYLYQIFYLLVPLILRDKPHLETRLHRYAVLIAARNEESVIGHLLDSIGGQDYPAELINVFVVADNCTDSTAQIARSHGAAVYERTDTKRVGKGYALDFLLTRIREDYGDAFDGFFVFDADNLLCPDYISAMNRTFSDGYGIVTSYRNSKNFGDNWISAGYALWFLREAEFLNHARTLLGLSAAVSGTGFLFSREVLARCNGWRFFLLTEDIEFTVCNVTNGVKIGYAPDAMLFDEQPVTFRQSWRQRMRWAKGYLQVFRKYGGKLLRGIGEGSFSCYDMAMCIMPAIIITCAGAIVNALGAVISILSGGGVLSSLMAAMGSVAGGYLFMLAVGAITTVTQWKRIYTPTWKKLLYTFTFPLFMLTYIPISLSAMFSHVEWKPIEHTVSRSIHDMKKIV